MSKLALVTLKKMCKIAEKRGFQKLRQKGSHAIYANAFGNSTVSNARRRYEKKFNPKHNKRLGAYNRGI